MISDIIALVVVFLLYSGLFLAGYTKARDKDTLLHIACIMVIGALIASIILIVLNKDVKMGDVTVGIMVLEVFIGAISVYLDFGAGYYVGVKLEERANKLGVQN